MASAATMAKLASAKPHLFYMSAWFCPFAHRATLALEHHGREPARGVPFPFAAPGQLSLQLWSLNHTMRRRR